MRCPCEHFLRMLMHGDISATTLIQYMRTPHALECQVINTLVLRLVTRALGVEGRRRRHFLRIVESFRFVVDRIMHEFEQCTYRKTYTELVALYAVLRNFDGDFLDDPALTIECVLFITLSHQTCLESVSLPELLECLRYTEEEVSGCEERLFAFLEAHNQPLVRVVMNWQGAFDHELVHLFGI